VDRKIEPPSSGQQVVDDDLTRKGLSQHVSGPSEQRFGLARAELDRQPIHTETFESCEDDGFESDRVLDENPVNPIEQSAHHHVDRVKINSNVKLSGFHELSERIRKCGAIETLFSPIMDETTPAVGTHGRKREDDDNHFRFDRACDVSPIARDTFRLVAQVSPERIPQEYETDWPVEAAPAHKNLFRESKHDPNPQLC